MKAFADLIVQMRPPEGSGLHVEQGVVFNPDTNILT